MERVQRALAVQLSSLDDKLSAELRGKTAEHTRVKSQREEIGVELYGLQQALAKLQIGVEKEDERVRLMREKRANVEATVKAAENNLAKLNSERAEIEARRAGVQKEYERVLSMLRNVRELGEKVASDVGVTKRSAYGSENAAANAERAKRAQDDLIWALKSELAMVEEGCRVTTAQCERQKEECARAEEAVKEARAELERVRAEKHLYQSKWEECMNVMTRKDAVVDDVNAMVTKTREQVLDVQANIAGAIQDIARERKAREKVEELVARRNAERDYVKTQMDGLNENRTQLLEDVRVVRASITESEQQLAKANSARKTLEGVLAQLQRDYEKAVAEQQRLDDEVMKNVGMQSGVERECSELYKQVMALVKECKRVGEELAKVRNESARVDVDTVNSRAHVRELEERKAAAEARVKEREEVVIGYEKHMRSIEDKMKKKQNYLARLVKELAEATKKQTAEEGGNVLEVMVRKCRADVKRLVAENEELGHRWALRQGEVVAVRKQYEEEDEKRSELLARGSVLKQKLLRVERDNTNVQDEARGVEKEMRLMERALRRGHEMLVSLSEREKDLQRRIERREEHGVLKVQGGEEDLVNLEAKKEKLEEERQRAMRLIVEVEEKCLHMEKKIELLDEVNKQAKEQDSAGGELDGMRKEIQRMKLRLQSLKKEEERMVEAVVDGVKRQEQQRMTKILVLDAVGKGNDKASIVQKIGTMKEKVRRTLKEREQVVREVERVAREIEQLCERVGAEEQESRQVREKLREAQETVGALEWEKERQGVEIGIADSVVRMLREMKRRVESGKGPRLNKDVVERELSKEAAASEELKQKLLTLPANTPKQQQWLERIANTLK